MCYSELVTALQWISCPSLLIPSPSTSGIFWYSRMLCNRGAADSAYEGHKDDNLMEYDEEHFLHIPAFYQQKKALS
ncbi:hypothetical protein E2C01_025068 [Portunus trituberculatus]|uniref:Uncharacterized protein n=1 Tax=Portunus trituberculatus TaxID=210409 RepID=A0A5B7EC74_PORTR|nr:hypothetical protein [Portunus trituberculatus]